MDIEKALGLYFLSVVARREGNMNEMNRLESLYTAHVNKLPPVEFMFYSRLLGNSLREIESFNEESKEL